MHHYFLSVFSNVKTAKATMYWESVHLERVGCLYIHGASNSKTTGPNLLLPHYCRPQLKIRAYWMGKLALEVDSTEYILKFCMCQQFQC